VGQILGLGYGGGEKTKGSTTPDVPPELRALYGQITDVAGSNVPAYKALISQVLAGNRNAVDPFTAPSVSAYTAPMASQMQNAVAAIRRATARGGGQDQAVANALRQGGMQIGEAQGRVGQQDIQAKNAMMQKVLELYSSLFGGFNPAATIAQKQETGTGARLGLPFADVPL
jgi:hypothetical protein